MPFANPEGNVEQVFLEEGMKVADLGAGVGAYTVPLAKKVGDTGKVYAVEVQKELLGNIRSNAEQAGVHNVEYLWGNIEQMGGSKIADHAVDLVVVANVLFQVEDKQGTVDEIRRILKIGGHVLVVDWRGSFDGMGPQQDMVLTAEAARALFEGSGFGFERIITTGSQHYGFLVTRNG
jgi:ubiquinone/menaquinone biosynthesis C-methylase UbiE